MADEVSGPTDDGVVIRKSIGLTRVLAIVLFGLLLPMSIAIRVDMRIGSAETFITQAASSSYIMDQFKSAPEKFRTGNDYALVALADSQRANQAIMLNKQVMKLVVIYMGFAVMSFAMMFIVLGFTDAPVVAEGSGAGFSLNLQFGSIGAAVFVLGAAMAAGGGLLRSDFRTVGLPAFVSGGPSPPSLFKGALQEIVEGCAKLTDEQDQGLCLTATLEAKSADNGEVR